MLMVQGIEGLSDEQKRSLGFGADVADDIRKKDSIVGDLMSLHPVARGTIQDLSAPMLFVGSRYPEVDPAMTKHWEQCPTCLVNAFKIYTLRTARGSAAGLERPLEEAFEVIEEPRPRPRFRPEDSSFEIKPASATERVAPSKVSAPRRLARAGGPPSSFGGAVLCGRCFAWRP